MSRNDLYSNMPENDLYKTYIFVLNCTFGRTPILKGFCDIKASPFNLFMLKFSIVMMKIDGKTKQEKHLKMLKINSHNDS